MLHRYAQTNLQLYNQMHDRGYATTDLAQMQSAYDFSLQLFAGLFRANGKPFLNHMVGTASILVDRLLPTPIAVAGLMHASYSHGSFAFMPRNYGPWKRRKILGALGAEVEALVQAYTHFRFNADTIDEIIRRSNNLTELERQACIIRLANDLEDHLDQGLAFCGKSKLVYARPGTLARVQTLADSLRHADLVGEIQQTVEIDTQDAPDSYLISSRTSSFRRSCLAIPSPCALLKRLVSSNG